MIIKYFITRMTRRERTIRTMTIGMAVYLRTLFETLLQEVLMKRLGPQAHIINLKLNHTVPASVRLLPAKEYRGAAIGINYDLRVYTGKLRYCGEIIMVTSQDMDIDPTSLYLLASSWPSTKSVYLKVALS